MLECRRRVAKTQIELGEREARTGGGRAEIVGERPRDRLGRQRTTISLAPFEGRHPREEREKNGLEVVLSELARDFDSLNRARGGLCDSLLDNIGMRTEEKADRKLVERTTRASRGKRTPIKLSRTERVSQVHTGGGRHPEKTRLLESLAPSRGLRQPFRCDRRSSFS